MKLNIKPGMKIHCQTEHEAKDLLSYLGENGYQWANGNTIDQFTHWDRNIGYGMTYRIFADNYVTWHVIPYDHRDSIEYSDLIRGWIPIAYICSKYSGNIQENTEAARRYSRFATDEGYIAIAPHLLFPQYIKEDEERELAMEMDRILLRKCDELWVFGEDLSNGMREEIREASRIGMMIRYFHADCTPRKTM